MKHKNERILKRFRKGQASMPEFVNYLYHEGNIGSKTKIAFAQVMLIAGLGTAKMDKIGDKRLPSYGNTFIGVIFPRGYGFHIPKRYWKDIFNLVKR